jgi:hypothetical protein
MLRNNCIAAVWPVSTSLEEEERSVLRTADMRSGQNVEDAVKHGTPLNICLVDQTTLVACPQLNATASGIDPRYIKSSAHVGQV